VIKGGIVRLGQRASVESLAIADHLTEIAMDFQHAGRGPSENHRAPLPMPQPRDFVHPAEQAFDQEKVVALIWARSKLRAKLSSN